MPLPMSPESSLKHLMPDLDMFSTQKMKSKLLSFFFGSQFRTREAELAKMLALDTAPANKILVGTHHKTGTAWMMKVFWNISHFHSLKYYQGKQEQLPPDYDIFFQDHSYFDFDLLESPFRGLHLIRDPRDVIISGCFYHQKADEDWLQYPREDLEGATYQEKINEPSNLDEKILFEMEHAGKRTIEEMLAWNYQDPLIMEVKYEDLIVDNDLSLFHEIFTFLGFPGPGIPSLLAIAYENSLFSGNFDRSFHIRSGKIEQWREYFTTLHKEKFLALFDDALIQLGYESDHKWAVNEA